MSHGASRTCQTELIKGMIEIIKEKTKKDVDAISKNDAIFVHNLNETLDFHKVRRH
jgi:hypothetical protein